VETEKSHLDKKCQKSQQIIRKLQAELEEEKQMSKILGEDKQTLTTRNAELEKLREKVFFEVSASYFHFRRSKTWKNKSTIS
jgi:uncharacterized protein (DUF342 family)